MCIAIGRVVAVVAFCYAQDSLVTEEMEPQELETVSPAPVVQPDETIGNDRTVNPDMERDLRLARNLARNGAITIQSVWRFRTESFCPCN